jgi:hypothetical protein
MGDAARRKREGTYPDATDPIAAARRFWCGRNQVPVEDFRVPDGLLAITFDVAGAAPTTCMIDPSRLVEALEGAAAVIQQTYYQTVRGTAYGLLQAKRQGDDETLPGIGLMGVWTAFNHPKSGDAFRRGVSRRLRETGKAHITWRFGPAGLAMAMGDAFVDLEALIGDGVAGRSRLDAYCARSNVRYETQRSEITRSSDRHFWHGDYDKARLGLP